ncbi:MAG: hypothetical protein K5654_03100 [Lachnospiraceae bacterium]|nr:hypothetical protein [Lachnospiraceae bacterium]
MNKKSINNEIKDNSIKSNEAANTEGSEKSDHSVRSEKIDLPVKGVKNTHPVRRENSDHPVRREKLENLKKASSLPLGKRLVYYWDFFKFYIIGALVFSVIAFIFIKQVLFAPDVIFKGYIVNRTSIPSCTDEEFISSFPLYQTMNTKKERMYFSSDMLLSDSDYESSVKLIASAASGEVDCIICNEKTYNRLAQMQLLESIDNNTSIKEKYESKLITYDHTKNDTDEDDSLGLKTYGIEVSDSAVLHSFHAFSDDEKVYLCIGINAYIDDTTLAFIDWVCE